MRAVARDAARRIGIDALPHYRQTVAQKDPAVGAIAGVGRDWFFQRCRGGGTSAGQPAGEGPRPRHTRLCQLGAVSVDEMIALLHDPSPTVVREVTAALRSLDRAVPASLPWQLMADQRVELRRAGYRLLSGQSAAVRLRAALLLAADTDPRLAQRGREDATRIARDAASPAWRGLRQPALSVTAGELADLEHLAGHAATLLGEETTTLLFAWLRASRPRS